MAGIRLILSAVSIYLTWYCFRSSTNGYAFIALMLILFLYPATIEKFWRKPGGAARIDEMADDLYNLYPTGQPNPKTYTGDEEYSPRLFLIERKRNIHLNKYQPPEPMLLVIISRDDIKIAEHPKTEEARKKKYTPLKIEIELEELEKSLLIQIKRGYIINIAK